MTSEEQTVSAAVAAASIIIDPIQQLLMDVESDPGACFEDDALDALAELRSSDAAKYQRMRAKLQFSKVNVRELDKLTMSRDGKSRGTTSSIDILQQVADDIDLFRTPGGEVYADVMVDGHRETWAISSQGFCRWLTRGFFMRTDQAPGAEHLRSFIETLKAKAQFGMTVREVHLRTAESDGTIYIDLADTEWKAVEIDCEGWRIVTDPPVRFRRANGMLSLPEPRRGGSLEALRGLLNLQNDAEFIMTTSWLVTALRPGGPFPVLAVTGEQGAAKSTFSAYLRALVDPSEVPLKTLPRDEQNLFITASNSHVVAFDNISSICPWLSDALCRVATGGGFSTRKLYTDQDEVIINVVKPMILNGISEFVTRPDLGDRSVFMELAPISDAMRRPKREVDAEFEEARPGLLGALYDAVALGLRRVGTVSLDRSPRMADYAKWSVACETAFGDDGCFMAAFTANREALVDNIIESDCVATALLAFARKELTWSGTATQLLVALGKHCPEGERKDWPQNAKRLSELTKRAATFLRRRGVQIDWKKGGRDSKRMIHIAPISISQDQDTAHSS